MQHYTDWAADTAGNALSGVSISVYAAGTANLATLYTDNGITTGSNPITSGADGNYDFYAANGRYDLVLTKTGYTFVAADTAGIALFDLSALSITSWTPSVGGTATYSSRTGSYLKIGPLVFIYGFMTINSIGTGSTSTISGIPYLPAHDTPIVVTRTASLALSVVSLAGFVNSGGLQIDLRGRTAAADTETTLAVLGDASSITVAGAYMTNQ